MARALPAGDEVGGRPLAAKDACFSKLAATETVDALVTAADTPGVVAGKLDSLAALPVWTRPVGPGAPGNEVEATDDVAACELEALGDAVKLGLALSAASGVSEEEGVGVASIAPAAHASGQRKLSAYSQVTGSLASDSL